MVEARDRVGGRTEGGHTTDGTPVELGGQWLGPTQNRMYELVDELGLSTFPTYNSGEHLIHLAGRTGRLEVPPRRSTQSGTVRAGRSVPWAPPVRRRRQHGAARRPWNAPGAASLDGQTFETWIRANLRTEIGRAYFRIATEAVFSAESSDLSALHAAFYAHSGAGLETLFSVDRGAQQDRVVGGTIRISEQMAARLGDRVRLGCPVRRIGHGADQSASSCATDR